MGFPTISLSLLLAASCSQAFIFPAHLPGGTYTVSIDNNGNGPDNITLISPLDSRYTTDTSIRPRQAPRLPSPQTNCHKERSLGHRAEYDSALSTFNTICDQATYYQPQTALVVSSGSAVAYLCNYERANRCWSSESNEADSLINTACGGGGTGIGWVYIDAYKKAYGRENVGVDIC